MDDPNLDDRHPFVISCKAPRSLTEVIDRVVREHPAAFPDKSTFVRKSLIRMLRDLGYIGGGQAGRLTVDELSRTSPIDDLISSIFAVDSKK